MKLLIGLVIGMLIGFVWCEFDLLEENDYWKNRNDKDITL